MIGSSRVLDLWTSLTASMPRTEAVVIRHFQARMPSGLVAPLIVATAFRRRGEHIMKSQTERSRGHATKTLLKRMCIAF
jgi:hypothetical protein